MQPPKFALATRVALAAAIAVSAAARPAQADPPPAGPAAPAAANGPTAEDRANEALGAIARRQEEIDLVFARLKAALERQVGAPYSTLAEAETATALLGLVSRLGERN